MEVRGSGVGRLAPSDVKSAFLIGLAVFVVAGATATVQWVSGQDFGPWSTLIVAALVFLGDCAKRFLSDTQTVRVQKLSHNSRAGTLVAYKKDGQWKYGLLRQWQHGNAVVAEGSQQYTIEVGLTYKPN